MILQCKRIKASLQATLSHIALVFLSGDGGEFVGRSLRFMLAAE